MNKKDRNEGMQKSFLKGPITEKRQSCQKIPTKSSGKQADSGPTMEPILATAC